MAAWTLPSAAQRLPALDGLRTVAIAPVLLVHARFVSGGFLGVTLFFALSGFLITSLLIDERRRTGAIAMRAFYARRIARLYPALLLGLALAAGVAVVIGERTAALVASLVIAATYTANLVATVSGHWLQLVNPTWSLAQEEQFYLVAPWVLRRIRLDRLWRTARIAFALAGGLALIRLAVMAAAPGSFPSTYENPLLDADAMLVGLGLALALGTAEGRRWFRFAASSITAACAAIAFTAAVVLTRIEDWSLGVGTLVATAAAAGILAHLTCSAGSPASRFLEIRGIRAIGERVYGIYLFHLPVFVLLGVPEDADIIDRMGRFLIATAISVGLAFLSARFVERPILRAVRRRQRRPLPGRADRAAPLA